MEIVKNDVIGFVNSLKYDHPDRKSSQKGEYIKKPKGSKEESSAEVYFDRVRSSAMKLDDTIKEHQTLITNYQMQLEFLKPFQGVQGWRERLRDFINDFYTNKSDRKFSVNILKDLTLTEYQEKLQEEVRELQRGLNRSQVQLQNIFASGLLQEPGIHRDVADIEYDQAAGNVFKNLRPESVQNLLQGL